MAFDNSKGRSKVNKEVKDDLKKSVEHLLTDAHEELLHNYLFREEIEAGKVEAWTSEECLLHAQKRVASLQAKIAIRMERLVWGTIIIALLALAVSIIALYDGSGCL